jgi:hypothetical protein
VLSTADARKVGEREKLFINGLFYVTFFLEGLKKIQSEKEQ